MEVLHEMIWNMDRHAVRKYKLFAERTGASEAERKDLYYFGYVRERPEGIDEDRLFRKLYGNGQPDKNAFYRLKNRLLQSVSLGTFLYYYEKEAIMQCLYYIALGYHYSSVNQHKAALHFFIKAKGEASSMEHYGLLDIIYSQMIRLARELVSINPEIYIKKRKENRHLLNRLSEAEDMLEALEYRMKISQNLATPVHIPELLRSTLDEYSRDEELKASPKVQFGIYFIVSRSLLQKRDYPQLETYLTETYASFEKNGLFHKSNHAQKLQMLAWLANSAFMNKRHKLSLQYGEQLQQEMERYDKAHFAQFELFYYNIQVINYSAIDPPRALEILNRLLRTDITTREPYYGVFVHMNLALIYFHQKIYKPALRHLQKLYTLQGYTQLEEGVKLRVNLGECMVHFELGNTSTLPGRIKALQKEFKSHLEKPESARESRFAGYLYNIATEPGSVKQPGFKAEVKKYLDEHTEAWSAENQMFGYADWLRTRLHLTS